MSDYPKIAQLKTVDAFRARLTDLGLDLPVDNSVLTAAQGSPLAKSWPLRFEGSWEEFTNFSRAVDLEPRLRKGGMAMVSYFNNAVINRHFLRYNFAAKTEWPPELCDRPGPLAP